jgi:alanyl-tRNA synthetase
VAGIVRTSESDVVDQIEKLLSREKSMEHELQQLKTKVAQDKANSLQPRDVKGVKVIIARVDPTDRGQLRVMVDSIRNRYPESVVVLGTNTGDEVSIVGGVTKNIASRVHAGKLVNSASQLVGGKGGGRPEMAEGGGKDPSKLEKALEEAFFTVEGML